MESRSHAPRSHAARGVRILLFDAEGKDRRVQDLASLNVTALGDHELAWIDVIAQGKGEVEAVFRTLRLDVPEIPPVFDPDCDPLSMRDEWYAARAVAPCWDQKHAKLDGAPWLLVVGPNIVLTAHKKDVEFLDQLFAHHDPASHIGELDADSFSLVLLDRMLTAYFAAMDAFAEQLDKLEVGILEDRVHDGHVPHLRRLRRAASDFRRLLSAHRELFDAIRRPDFRPKCDNANDKRFKAVANRYERAMDVVEIRDLVVGSYELLETRLSQRTNETMRILTFATVLLGGLAVIAGVLGMNFHAELFDTGSRGFWMTVGGMIAIIVGALLFARWQK
jgi:Mg2+ and Co2+ transporter CorA